MANYYLYTTAKRHNSTLVPSGGIQAALVLKSGTSLLKPTFLLEISQRPTATMVSFEGRYYFVTDIISVRNNLWEIECEVDPLSTYKTEILSTSGFVMYDTTANTELIDSRLSRNTTELVNSSNGNFSKLGAVSGAGRGTVVIGVVTDDGCMYYALSAANAANLLSSINSSEIPNLIEVPEIGDITDLVTAADIMSHNASEVLTFFVSSGTASRCIVGCKEIALGAGAFYGPSEQIYLGTFPTGVTGTAISGRRVDVDTVTVTIPWRYTDWRRNSPYTKHYFYTPFVGLIALPEDQIIGMTSIYVEAYYDMISGDLICEVSATNGAAKVFLGCYSGSISCEFSMGSTAIPYSKQISALGGVAGGIGQVIGGDISDGNTTAIKGILSAYEPVPTSISGGGGGACLAMTSTCYVIEVCHNTNVEPNSVSAIMGTPARAVKSLSGLSGYVETRGFSCAGSMTDTERDMINRLMDGGVYIE